MHSNTVEEEIKYSKLLSSLFCSASIVVLSFLCILNNFSIDFYSMLALLKIVFPAAFCFWFIGFSIGKILDGFNKKIIKEKVIQEKEIYEMPSMFAGTDTIQEDDLGI